jgi:hypothetical protein
LAKKGEPKVFRKIIKICTGGVALCTNHWVFKLRAKVIASDLNAKEGVIMIRHGKGNRQRLVPLSDTLLNLLRQYWQQHKPDSVWVFPGLGKNKLVRVDYLSSLFRMANKSVKFVNWAAATA